MDRLARRPPTLALHFTACEYGPTAAGASCACTISFIAALGAVARERRVRKTERHRVG